jgi:hypothetical protein
LDVHNEAVRSMRYPPDEVYRKELQNQAGGKSSSDKKDGDKQDEKTIEEIIKEMEEEEED